MLGEIKKLCTPAMIYFLVSVFTLFVMIFSNIGNKGSFCMGNYDCPVDNVYLIYIIKAVYLLFVTIVLDSLCKNGYSGISWFLVFFPIMFYFIALGLFMIMKQNSSVMIVQEQQEQEY
jgi:hypothetical protein|tara:strand:+ start:4840 stop:5193 length:354 start_codon:yes stop_codon:yes gene_type:complete